MAEMAPDQSRMDSSKPKKCAEVGEGLVIIFASFAGHGAGQMRHASLLISWACYEGVIRDRIPIVAWAGNSS